MEQRLRSAALETLPTMIAITDGNGGLYHATDELLEATGHDRDELIGKPVETLLSGYDRDRLLERADGEDELALVTGTDSRVPVRVTARQLPAAPGSETEQAVALLVQRRTDSSGFGSGPESESGSGPNSESDADAEGVSVAVDSVDRIFEHVDDAVVLVDVEADRFLRHNDAASELFGYDPGEFGSVRPSDIHTHEYEAFREFAEEVFEYGHAWTDQLSCRTCEGELIEAEISGTAVETDGTRLLLATIRDVSTRVQQERELLRWSRALAAVTDGIAVLSEDGTVRYANRAYASLFGFDDPDAVAGRHWRELYEPSDRFELEIAPETRATDEWHGDATGLRRDGSTFPVDLSLTRIETGDFVCVARDVSKKRRHERRLGGLLDATRELMKAAGRPETARIAVDAAVDALGYEIATLRLYDASANELRRAATTDAAESLLESELAYDLKASNAGTAYRTGETVCNEPADDAYAAASSRADLHVPIEDLGVLTVIDPEGSFGDTDVQLVELLGESVRAALRRADREERLRERRAELEQRRDELAITDQFNTLVVDVIQSIFGSTSRTETGETVCDRLANSSLYDAACIVTTDEETGWALETGSIAEDTSLVDDPAAFVESPFVRQLLEESDAGSGVATTRRRFDSQRGEEETLAAAVSIACGDATFGELVLATTDPPEFGDAVRSGFSVLGEALGFAFLADRRQKTLQASESIELEFVYESPFGDLSGEFDCRCIHERKVKSEGDPVYRITVTDGSCEAIEAFLREYDSVTRCTVVNDRDDRCVVHVTVDNPPPNVLARTGVNLRSLVAEHGETRMIVEVASDIDVETVIEQLESTYYRNIRLVAKRQRPRPLGEFALDAGDRLTNRQASVLRTAHESGYYEWPRDRTAEEIADSLDIASSTLHQHLRAAENKLVSAFLSE
jgi:PAS domain S-box-containing protein